VKSWWPKWGEGDGKVPQMEETNVDRIMVGKSLLKWSFGRPLRKVGDDIVITISKYNLEWY
jgi:hypothetical protein